MSRETIQHLNTQTLIGFTDKRGHAWHYRAEDQGSESNHYTGAVPVADVHRRLFHWSAQPAPVLVRIPATMDTMTGLDAEGRPYRDVVLDDKQAITRSDTGDVFGIFSQGYTSHQYGEWLVNAVSTLLGDTVSIGSAGLLKGGAVAWVSVEVPDTIRTPEGVTFRPNLLAATSHDGSMATTYKRVVTNTVCDNTMAMALREDGQQYKIRHSRYSKIKLGEARDALAMLELTADAFSEEVKALCETTVTDKQWQQYLDTAVIIDPKPGRSRTMATTKQDELKRLWNHDERVSPWKNTAYGVVQAVNTYTHHIQSVKGATRSERNMLRAVSGGVDTLDRETFTVLGKILSNA